MEKKRCLNLKHCKAVFVLTITLGLLMDAGPGYAETCKSLFSKGSEKKPTAEYQFLRRHQEGERLASRAIEDLGGNYFNPEGPVWTEYTKDPRFGSAPPMQYSLYDALRIVELRNHTPAPEMKFKLFSSQYWYDHSGYTPFRFLLNWDGLGIRAINRLIANRIYPLTLEPRTPGTWEHNGKPMSKMENLFAEINRAHRFEMSIEPLHPGGPTYFESELFKVVIAKYDQVVTTLDPRQRVLFDTAFYLVHYQSDYLVNLINKLQDGCINLTFPSKQQVSEKDIQKVYQEVASQFQLNFQFDGFLQKSVRVKLIAGDNSQPGMSSYSLIDRFLNPKDLADLLPADIQAKIDKKPTEAKKIVAEFLSESLSLFFGLHYAETKQILIKRISDVDPTKKISTNPDQALSPHLGGEKLAALAIDDPDAKVWTDYTTDPRYGNSTPLESPLFDAINVVQSRNPGAPVPEMRYRWFSVERWKDSQEKTPFRFLPTWEPLGVRAINRLIANRIYPLTLEPRTPSTGEYNGKPMSNVENLFVEIHRALNLEIALDPRFWSDSYVAASELYQAVITKYDEIVATLDSRQRVRFDTAFYLAHYGSQVVGNLINVLHFNSVKWIQPPRTQISEKDIQQIYRENTEHFGLNFQFDGFFQKALKVTLMESGDAQRGMSKYSLIDRFLNPKDLAGLLPEDIQAKIGKKPTEAKKIVAEFLNESFSLFFNLHYAETTKVLKKHLVRSNILMNFQASGAYKIMSEEFFRPPSSEDHVETTVTGRPYLVHTGKGNKVSHFTATIEFHQRKDNRIFTGRLKKPHFLDSRADRIKMCLAIFEGITPEEIISLVQEDINIYLKQAQNGVLSNELNQPMLEFYKSFSKGDFHLEINIENAEVDIVPGKKFSGRRTYIMYP